MSDEGKEVPEQTFFNVIDSIEDQFDDSEDEESLHSSSEHSSIASEQVKLDDVFTDSDEEAQKEYKDKRINAYYTYTDEQSCIVEQECTEIAEPGEETNECYVIEQPEDLNEKGPLPEGWKEIFHESGIPLYIHIETNVCSLSRPYFLGTGSTKSHLLPETAIPCLYNKNVENPEWLCEENSDDANESNQSDTVVRPKQAKIYNYCKRLFKFKKIKYLKFRSWDVRRSYLRTLRNERNRRKRPFSDKLITFPIVKKNEEGKIISSKKWIINPRGKSYVAILHEYLQQSLKTQPVYTFSEVDNARTPYAATVIVNGDEYGSGVGMSKREAKLEAAKATLLVLLPKMKKSIMKVCEKQKKTTAERSESEEEEQNIASVFDDIEITDPRVSKLSKKTTEPTPYELLMKCVQRKSDSQKVQINYNTESNEYTMTLGEHSVTVQCTNKRDGKQQAAQALLQTLHPYINNWGSLLRLYCNRTTDHYQFGPRNTTEDADIEETKHRSPNVSLLNTLRERMLKLQEKDKRNSSPV